MALPDPVVTRRTGVLEPSAPAPRSEDEGRSAGSTARPSSALDPDTPASTLMSTFCPGPPQLGFAAVAAVGALPLPPPAPALAVRLPRPRLLLGATAWSTASPLPEKMPKPPAVPGGAEGGRFVTVPAAPSPAEPLPARSAKAEAGVAPMPAKALSVSTGARVAASTITTAPLAPPAYSLFPRQVTVVTPPGPLNTCAAATHVAPRHT